MTDSPEPGAAEPGLARAVRTLIDEAETASRTIADLRGRLDAAELARRKLLTAIDAAIHALPPDAREGQARRLARLADTIRPARGRKPDSRRQAIVEKLAMLGHDGEDVVKTAEIASHLDRLGFGNMPQGYASNTLGRLAEQGFLVRTGHGRFRINAMHPELVALRFRLLDAEVETERRRTREIAEAEARGRRRAQAGG